ncbi:MAG TPA: hypothetical protein VIL28_14955 [Steroidobacteraceae bacterium]
MRTLGALLLLLGAQTAAGPIHVDFEIVHREGKGKPSRYVGSWSFDGPLVKPGMLFEDVFEGRRLRSFSFEWLGKRWTVNDVRLARLELDEQGRLRSWIIGSKATSGGCGNVGALDCVGVPTKELDFYLVATRPERGMSGPSLVAVGVRPGTEGFIEAKGTFRVRSRGRSTNRDEPARSVAE